MGVYKWDNITKPNMNNYPVYKNRKGQYLYLWDWGKVDILEKKYKSELILFPVQGRRNQLVHVRRRNKQP